MSWLLKNYSCTGDFVVAAKYGAAVERALRADGLDVAVESLGRGPGDYDDHYSSLLIATRRGEVGEWHAALTELVILRGDVLQSPDPRSRKLLPEIDAQIAIVHAALRTDRPNEKRGAQSRMKLPALAAWVRQTLDRIPNQAFRIAISIMVVVVYELVTAIM